MMDWYRWWHGSSTDPKFQMVAAECQVPLATVLGLWATLLEQASSSGSRGSLVLDHEVLSFQLGIDTVTPCNAMKRRGLLHETDGVLHVATWEKRQPKRECDDNSTDRVRKHRAVKNQEFIEDENHVTPCNANETQETPRLDKSRETDTNVSVLAESQKRDSQSKAKKVTLKTWLANIKANGEKAISDYKPVWEYAKRVGLPEDWIQIAWIKFVERYRDNPNSNRKQYIDWRRAFLDHVEKGYLKLWSAREDGKYYLTTVGVQAEIETREGV